MAGPYAGNDRGSKGVPGSKNEQHAGNAGPVTVSTVKMPKDVAGEPDRSGRKSEMGTSTKIVGGRKAGKGY